MSIFRKVLCSFLIIVFACLPAICLSSDFTALVVGVVDGDTVKVLSDGTEKRIRLYGIDCPEKRQPYWRQAKEFTHQAIFGKNVQITARLAAGTDIGGRLELFSMTTSV